MKFDAVRAPRQLTPMSIIELLLKRSSAFREPSAFRPVGSWKVSPKVSRVRPSMSRVPSAPSAPPHAPLWKRLNNVWTAAAEPMGLLPQTNVCDSGAPLALAPSGSPTITSRMSAATMTIFRIRVPGSDKESRALFTTSMRCPYSTDDRGKNTVSGEIATGAHVQSRRTPIARYLIGAAATIMHICVSCISLSPNRKGLPDACVVGGVGRGPRARRWSPIPSASCSTRGPAPRSSPAVTRNPANAGCDTPSFNAR